MNLDLTQVILILFVSTFLMLKASFSMLEKRKIFLFLPMFLIGFEMCFEAAFFYFQFPLSHLPGQIHDVFLVLFLVSCVLVFWRRNAN